MVALRREPQLAFGVLPRDALATVLKLYGSCSGCFFFSFNFIGAHDSENVKHLTSVPLLSSPRKTTALDALVDDGCCRATGIRHILVPVAQAFPAWPFG